MNNNRDHYDLFYQILYTLMEVEKKGDRITNLEMVCNLSHKQSRVYIGDLLELGAINVVYEQRHKNIFITEQGKELLMKLMELKSYFIT